MTKALTLTWIPPEDPKSAIISNNERLIQVISMELDGKTNSHHKGVKLDKHTLQRQWRDQESVDEYIKFMYNLANKYGGTVVVGETIDL